MFEINDHPDICRVMRTGRTTTDDGLAYRCPVCKSELEPDTIVYTTEVRGKRYVIGCADCVEIRTAEGLYA